MVLILNIKDDQNIPLPKKLKDVYETVTLEQALEVIEKNKDKPKRGGGGRTKSAPEVKPKRS